MRNATRPTAELERPAVSGAETMQLECVDCGRSFHTPVTRAFGVALYAIRCGGCFEARAQAETMPQEGPVPTDSLEHRDPMLEALRTAGVNVRKFADATFDTFRVDGGNRLAVEAMRSFMADTRNAGLYSPVRGVILIGSTGLGKTHLAVAAARALLADGTVSLEPGGLVFDRASSLITTIQDTYGSGGTKAVLELRKRAGLWILDDLGTEKGTEDALRILDDILDARLGAPTIITTNEVVDDIGTKFGGGVGWDRIRSRLARREFRSLLLGGADRRKAGPTA